MAFDLLVRAFFADNGLSAGLAKANAGLADIGRSGPRARVGLRAVEQGARTLAFEAAGLAGPMGRVASGLLQIGGGDALVLGAVAGLGAVALAYNALTKESREAAEAEKKHRDELVRSAAQRSLANLPESQRIGIQSSDLRDMLDAQNVLRRERVALVTGQFAAGAAVRAREGSTQTLDEVLRADKKLQDIDEARSALSLSIAQNRQASAKASRDEADAQLDILTEITRISHETATFGIFAGPDLTALKLPDIGAQESARQASLQVAQVERQGEAFAFRMFDQDFFDRVQGEVSAAIGDGVKTGGKDTGKVLAQGFMTAMIAFRQGGPGGVLGGFGTLATSASEIGGISKGLSQGLGIAGIGLNLVGGIFSLFDHSEERRHRELLRKLDQVAQEVGLERVTVVFTGPDGHEVRRALNELESGDAVARIPGPTGATG